MLRLALVRAVVVTCIVAVLAAMGVTRLPSPVWLAPLFLVWLFVAWRGSLAWRGALGGLVVGLAALALPTSVLRPCCATMMSGTPCTMPQVCVAVGAALGLLVAATLPRLRTPGEWARASAGGMIAVTSLVACRCTTLLVGETVGLLGALLASTAGIALTRAWWARRVVQR
jgi:hypothetical protein